jgi:hypothetical protein
MRSPNRILAALWPMAVLTLLWGCQTPGPVRSKDYLIIDLLDEFSLDQPSESWQFAKPDEWHIQSDGQRRFLYLVPQPAGAPTDPSAFESAVHSKYRFRNLSLSCWIRLDQATDGRSCDASILFGRQDDQNCLRLDLSDPAGKPGIAVTRVENGRPVRLDSASLASRPGFTLQQWHHVGILRNVETGNVEVYVDDSDRPAIKTRTTAYESGSIGLGSSTGGAGFGRIAVSGEATPTR